MTAEQDDELMIKLMVFLTQLEKGRFDLLHNYVKQHTLDELAADIQVAKATKGGDLGALAMDDEEYNMLCLYIGQHTLAELAANIEIAFQTKALLAMV